MTIEQILDDIRSDRVKNVVIDTDTYNEMDDQYAIAYALGSDRIRTLAITAAPFYNTRSTSLADGMERSYQEIHRVLSAIGKEDVCPVYKGSDRAISGNPDLAPVDSPAARAIIAQAHANPDGILYILALGAITNIMSAILLDPTIQEKICILWLGTNVLERGNAKEFNMLQDLRATQMLLNCGVPLVLLPALPSKDHPDYGTKNLVMYKNDLSSIQGSSPACEFYRTTLPGEFSAADDPEWKWIMWDLAAPAVLANPEALSLRIITAPVVCDDMNFAFDSSRHKILYMDKADPAVVIPAAFRAIEKL